MISPICSWAVVVPCSIVLRDFVKPNKYEAHVHAMMKEDDDNEASSPLASVTHFELQLPLVALTEFDMHNTYT